MTELDNKSKKDQIKTKKPIFTEDEIENTVKAFILAYIHNKIKITFPTSDDYKEIAKTEGNKINNKEAQDLEFNAKESFINFVQICSGNLDATDEERKDAVTELFDILLRARSSKRISGSFDDYELKRKMEELEDKLEATNNVLTELVNWLTEEAKGNENGLS
ncbi:hypothetical protein [Nitrosopumilus sp.]|uniref:hypothetical protein n=1 Tax=Nitrosopumilus sp. TaxID=2024843 RepID=UPI00260999B2|nr:hypothetical protein [Nitrosopumilus sp.]